MRARIRLPSGHPVAETVFVSLAITRIIGRLGRRWCRWSIALALPLSRINRSLSWRIPLTRIRRRIQTRPPLLRP
jgi:hypothetical protein